VNFKRNLEKSVKTARTTHIFFDKDKIEKKLKNKEFPSSTRFFQVVCFPQVSPQ